MKKKYIRILSVFLALMTTFSSLAITAYALSWDGSSAGGGGAGTSAGPNGYAIKTTDDNCIAHLNIHTNLRIIVVDNKSTEVFLMKFKDVKRYLTINRNEINAYISLVMKARNAYIDEQKPVEDIDELLCKLMKIKRKLRA